MDRAGSVKNFLGKVQKLVSTLTAEILDAGHKRQSANAKCWNSQLKMQNKKVCKVLEHFEEAADMYQPEKVVTTSLVSPCV